MQDLAADQPEAPARSSLALRAGAADVDRTQDGFNNALAAAAEVTIAKIIPRTGKKFRPKTAIKGKRFRCARCRRRSPKPVTIQAPWYCPACLGAKSE